MKYKLRLLDGTMREVLIYDESVFMCRDIVLGENVCLTKRQHREHPYAGEIILDQTKGYRLFEPSLGLIEDMNNLFKCYELLGKPIVELLLI